MSEHDELIAKVARAVNAARYANNPPEMIPRLEDEDARSQEYIYRLSRAALSAMPTAGDGWQDIASAPKDGTRVLLWMEPVNDARFAPTDGPHQVIGTWVVWSDAMKREGMREGWSWYGSALLYATKWKHLPPPPGAKP